MLKNLSLILKMTLVICWCQPAFAQYKNLAFGIESGGMVALNLPSVTDDNGYLIANYANRPDRLFAGGRLGLELAWKLQHDHWWLILPRINVQFLGYEQHDSSDPQINSQFDNFANSDVGTTIGLQFVSAFRYFFLTDKIRPYLQGGISYMYLWATSASANSSATDSFFAPSTLITATNSYTQNLLPHQNILALHVNPGIEFILMRDLGLVFNLDYQHWFIFTAPDGNYMSFNLGVIFYG